MKKTILIEGMMCEHCVKHVTEALSAMEGVKDVTVRLGKKKKPSVAEVELAEAVADEALAAAVTNAGYQVTGIE